MISEIIQFMNLLPDDFKVAGFRPKEGLHIGLKLTLGTDAVYRIDTKEYKYAMYSSKKGVVSPFLEECIVQQEQAWCINTNKCFDVPTKAIHSCSPYLVAFKKTHLRGGAKYIENEAKKKSQIYERFDTYFDKAFELLEDKEEQEKYEVFRYFFVRDEFSVILAQIAEEQAVRREELEVQVSLKKEESRATTDKQAKARVNEEIKEIERQLDEYRPLTDNDYILFYLDVPLTDFVQTHENYLSDNLFNTDKYNTAPTEEGVIYGTSNFFNGFNSKMPFLMHQTASFDITGRISNQDAKLLYEFSKILSNKTVPNPLPLFIYEEELELHMVAILQESGDRIAYQDLVKKLVRDYKKDLANYYLLFWQNTKDGLELYDFDFVAGFQYETKLHIENLFEVWDKEKKQLKSYKPIENIFDFERVVLKPFVQNKYNKLSYFSDLSQEGYEKLDGRFQSYAKYRKLIYDYIYKSQKTLLTPSIFDEMVFNAIRDDLKFKAEGRIKDKLNIWYSARHIFNLTNNTQPMGDKLKDYQLFVSELVSDEGTQREATDELFAFTAGMVIRYIMNKSQAADTSFQLLESYLQQARCTGLKREITSNFARYKHENYSKRFERAAAFVLSYDTAANMKELLPQILSGVFANNQLYSKTL